MSAAVKKQSDSYRRSMIAKIHVAKKQLGMVDDDYRQLLFNSTGKVSSAKCSDAELNQIIKALENKGFKALSSKGSKAADHPSAKKARALWISLHHLGAVRNSSERALESFAREQLQVARLQWADQSQSYKLIEALKAMANREGWDQNVPYGVLGQDKLVLLNKRLCEAILLKIKAADLCPADWDLADAADRLCGMPLDRFSPFRVEELIKLARALGHILRERR